MSTPAAPPFAPCGNVVLDTTQSSLVICIFLGNLRLFQLGRLLEQGEFYGTQLLLELFGRWDCWCMRNPSPVLLQPYPSFKHPGLHRGRLFPRICSTIPGCDSGQRSAYLWWHQQLSRHPGDIWGGDTTAGPWQTLCWHPAQQQQ